MNTVECPTCKRLLHAPRESGDHRVVCPGCGMAFAVVSADGVVRVISTSVSSEVPAEKPIPRMELDEPPELLPALDSNVYEDEGSRRTRRIHAVFKVVFLGTLAFFAYKFLSDPKGPPDWSRFFAFLPVVLCLAFLLAAGSALVVGNLISLPTESHERGERALHRMWKAYDEPPPPLDPSGPPGDSGERR